MVRRALLVVALAAAVPAAAPAKTGPVDLVVCGLRCVAIDQASSDAIFGRLPGHSVAPPATSSFYVLRSSADPTQTLAYWIPRAGVLRWDDGADVWASAAPDARAALARATAGVAPYPKPTLTHVYVGDRAARSPQTYLRLYGGGRPVTQWIASAWIFVQVTATAPNPWTDGYDLRVARSSPYVWRDWTIFRVSPRLARRARLGLPLR